MRDLNKNALSQRKMHTQWKWRYFKTAQWIFPWNNGLIKFVVFFSLPLKIGVTNGICFWSPLGKVELYWKKIV